MTVEYIRVGECNKCGKCCMRGEERCPFLTADNLCSKYKDRFQDCKDFPTLEDFKKGRIPKECGFKFIKKDNGK